MCEPTTLMLAAGIATSVLGAAQGYQAQNDAAEQAVEQQKYMNRQYTAQAKAAQEAGQANIDAITAQQQEVVAAADDEALQRQIEAKRERARAVVAAGEAGIGGITPALLEADIVGAAGRDVSTIYGNARKQVMQGQREKRAARRSGTTVGEPAHIGIPRKGSIGGAIAEAGLGISSSYLDYKGYKDSRKSPKSSKG